MSNIQFSVSLAGVGLLLILTAALSRDVFVEVGLVLIAAGIFWFCGTRGEDQGTP